MCGWSEPLIEASETVTGEAETCTGAPATVAELVGARVETRPWMSTVIANGPAVV